MIYLSVYLILIFDSKPMNILAPSADQKSMPMLLERISTNAPVVLLYSIGRLSLIFQT